MGDRGQQSPTVRQRRLRGELRRLREAAGHTQDEVAIALDWSLSKVIRIEGGVVGISTTDLRALLQHYGADDDRVHELIEVAKSARERSWWSSYRKIIGPGYAELIGYEAAASRMRQFELLVVPGLLQTEEYAREYIARLIDPELRGNVDALVEVRMRRQEILNSDDPLQVHFVVDEAAVQRKIGGRTVMRAQLNHLIETVSRPNVTIEVVPFSAGPHIGMRGSFTIIEFPDPEDEDVLLLESPRASRHQRGANAGVASYREAFEEIRLASLRPEDTTSYLRSLLASL